MILVDSETRRFAVNSNRSIQFTDPIRIAGERDFTELRVSGTRDPEFYDRFRLHILRELQDSNQKVKIRFDPNLNLPAHDLYENGERVGDGIRQLSRLEAVGITIISQQMAQNRQSDALPYRGPVLSGSDPNEGAIVYAHPGTLQHELFGHWFLQIRGANGGHTNTAPITEEQQIPTPLFSNWSPHSGICFTGLASDFIRYFIQYSAESGITPVALSPTLGLLGWHTIDELLVSVTRENQIGRTEWGRDFVKLAMYWGALQQLSISDQIIASLTQFVLAVSPANRSLLLRYLGAERTREDQLQWYRSNPRDRWRVRARPVLNSMSDPFYNTIRERVINQLPSR